MYVFAFYRLEISYDNNPRNDWLNIFVSVNLVCTSLYSSSGRWVLCAEGLDTLTTRGHWSLGPARRVFEQPFRIIIGLTLWIVKKFYDIWMNKSTFRWPCLCIGQFQQKLVIVILKLAGRQALTLFFRNNLSLFWPIDAKLGVWIACRYIKRQLGIATLMSVIKVNVTVAKNRISVSA